MGQGSFWKVRLCLVLVSPDDKDICPGTILAAKKTNFIGEFPDFCSLDVLNTLDEDYESSDIADYI